MKYVIRWVDLLQRWEEVSLLVPCKPRTCAACDARRCMQLLRHLRIFHGRSSAYVKMLQCDAPGMLRSGLRGYSYLFRVNSPKGIGFGSHEPALMRRIAGVNGTPHCPVWECVGGDPLAELYKF